MTATISGGCAAGNSTIGIFAHGNATGALNSYTYSSNAVASATAFAGPSNDGAATGNSVEGIFALGSSAGITTTSKYNYSANTNAATTVLSTVLSAGAAAGNAQPNTNVYVYSGDTVSAGANLSTNSFFACGASNGTSGVNA
jgi:hypothetical protein